MATVARVLSRRCSSQHQPHQQRALLLATCVSASAVQPDPISQRPPLPPSDLPSPAFLSLPLPYPFVPTLRQWTPPLPRPQLRLQRPRLCLDDASGLLHYEDSLQEKGKSPDPNKANMGKTLRILQERLPTVLQFPLPQDILSPAISLHLFPSTHPHLPAVSGRVAYNAALWTSPIAWNRVPLVGNVRVEVVSERMSRGPLHFGGPLRAGAVPEQLVVRWRTCSKRAGGGGHGGRDGQGDVASDGAGGGGGRDRETDFTGLFIFQFDEEGRILSHTIEHAQTGEGWDKGVGARVVGLTDWLLGGMRGQPVTDG